MVPQAQPAQWQQHPYAIPYQFGRGRGRRSRPQGGGRSGPHIPNRGPKGEGGGGIATMRAGGELVMQANQQLAQSLGGVFAAAAAHGMMPLATASGMPPAAAAASVPAATYRSRSPERNHSRSRSRGRRSYSRGRRTSRSPERRRRSRSRGRRASRSPEHRRRRSPSYDRPRGPAAMEVSEAPRRQDGEGRR